MTSPALATFDSYDGAPITLEDGTELILGPLRFADAMRLMALAERSSSGEVWAAAAIGRELPRMLHLDPVWLSEDDLLKAFRRTFDPVNWRQPVEKRTPGPRMALVQNPQPDPEPADDAGARAWTWDDLLADYAAVYRGLPRPDDPWPMFVALLDRTGRQDARERLRLLDSVTAAIAAALGGEDGSFHARVARDELVGAAFPAASDLGWIQPPQAETQP